MTPTALKLLADRVRRNSLDHRNPEAFYIEREEIADAILSLKLVSWLTPDEVRRMEG
jgi:hypothetical protein